MPNPLLFIVAIVAIDLVLRSMRNKKKREQSRRVNIDQDKRQETVENRNKNIESTRENTRSTPIRELKRTLEEEFKKQKKAEEEVLPKEKQTVTTMEKSDTRDGRIKAQRKKVEEHSELERMKRRKEELKRKNQLSRKEYKEPIKQALVAKTEKDKEGFREDVLKGIIFSEILGKPKSLKK